MCPTPCRTETAGKGLQALGVAGQAAQVTLVPIAGERATEKSAPTGVALFDQGLVQLLQAAVTGLEPGRPYVLALSRRSDRGGRLQPLAAFTTNAAGAAIVNAV